MHSTLFLSLGLSMLGLSAEQPDSKQPPKVSLRAANAPVLTVGQGLLVNVDREDPARAFRALDGGTATLGVARIEPIRHSDVRPVQGVAPFRGLAPFDVRPFGPIVEIAPNDVGIQPLAPIELRGETIVPAKRHTP